MPMITATFSIELPHSITVRGVGSGDHRDDWQVPADIAAVAAVDGPWHREVVLNPRTHTPTSWSAEDGAYFEVDLVSIRVAREETEEPPGISINELGGRDLRARDAYFDERRAEYVEAARRTADRFIRHLRFQMGVPGVRGVRDVSAHVFANPRWTGPDGAELASGTFSGIIRLPSAQRQRDRGVVIASSADGDALRTALSEDRDVPLHRELEALGRDAAFEGYLSRAVIEFAVAAEVAVKQSFFAPSSAAFEAFQFLEEKRKVEVTVVELLRQPAERAFGQRFDQVAPVAAERVEELFQCRNKVAHRGRLEYRDRKGSPLVPDKDKVFEWWSAPSELLSWLENDCGLTRIRPMT